MIRIFLLQKAAIVIPVLYILLHQHLIFIGQAPPHIVVSCQSGNAIRHIEKRSFLCHLCKSPIYHKDETGSDPPRSQVLPAGEAAGPDYPNRPARSGSHPILPPLPAQKITAGSSSLYGMNLGKSSMRSLLKQLFRNVFTVCSCNSSG